MRFVQGWGPVKGQGDGKVVCDALLADQSPDMISHRHG